MAWIGVETNNGAAMIGQAAGGDHLLTISGGTVGSGSVAEANMRIATALQESKMAISIVDIKTITGGVKLRLRIAAAPDIVGAFTAHEIGIWGHLDNDEDQLIILCQNLGNGTDIPAESQSSEFVYDLYVPIIVSNAEDLVVTLDTNVYATMDDLSAEAEARADADEEINDILENDVVTKEHDLINNGTYTGTGKALDARMGKTLTDDLAALNDKIHTQFYADATLGNNNAGFHNALYRGKYLGDHVTDDQYAQISAGTFDDLFIGDYWTIGGVNWRIAAFDYWYNCGDTNCTTHHVVIVPDSNLAYAQMNDTNITTGAYVGSDFYTGNNSNTGKASMMTAINNAFGTAHILTHREYLQNAVTNGYESAGTWYDSTAELMTERMVYGSNIFHNQMSGTNNPYSYNIEKGQLPLFQHDHSQICNRYSYWLRDVASSAHFAHVGFNGLSDHQDASNSMGIRPGFGIRA